MDRTPPVEATPNTAKLLPGAGTYTVHLSIDVTADSPADSVEGFVAEIVDVGLRAFVYRTQHLPSGVTLFVGDGEVLTEDELTQRMTPLAG